MRNTVLRYMGVGFLLGLVAVTIGGCGHIDRPITNERAEGPIF